MAKQVPFIEPDPEEESVWRIVIPIPTHKVCVWPPNEEAEEEIKRRLSEGEEFENILASGETFDF